MTSVIIDLDVLADSRWRSDLRPSGGGPESWEGYHAAGVNDTLDFRAFMLVTGLHRMGTALTVVSHRPEPWMRSVMQWLINHEVPIYRIVLRRAGDFRPNSEVMADLIGNEPTPDFAILGDDERVIEAVRATGVFIVQVSRP